jgi:signal transduction histidine kinase
MQEDLNVVLLKVKEEIKEVIEEKNAIIESDPLPVANVISFQFHQLLENLLLNALKYNKPGIDPHIKISCSIVNSHDQAIEKGLPHGTFYKIDVADNGIGFEEQYNQKIFELFQRLHGKSEYPGTGLGLAICRRIVQNHEGLIVAKGTPGVGAVFTIYLPV